MEPNGSNQLTVPITALTEDKEETNVFLKHRCTCKYGNGKLTTVDKSTEESKGSVELLYGLHDSPAIHISFLCGLQVSCSILCNVQPRQATANPVGGKACSSTNGGLLRYILNIYSIHKVSSLKFAYFQGRLPRHITSPSEKTRPESWPGDYMGKATPVWQLSLSHRCHQM